MKRILEVGPSETGSRGGMAGVIRGLRESEGLNREFIVHSFPSYIDGSLPVRLAYSLYGLLRFWLLGRNYDIVHLHTAEKGSTFRKSLYLRAAKRAGAKVVVHIHGAEYLTFYDALGRRGKGVVEDFFRQADLVLALSDSWKRELEARFSMKACETLYNGVELSLFEQGAGDPAEHQRNFLMLGRLGERKGTYDLIEAMELALRRDPELTLCLAGDGEVEKVRALVAEKGLENSITVTGWIGREETLKRLGKAATVVLPSYHEGLPLSILEGMAAGKAILSTTAGAIPEAVTGENGILVEPGDVPALAEGLLRLSGDVELLRAISRNNRQRVKQVFSLEQMHSRLAGQYRRLLEEVEEWTP